MGWFNTEQELLRKLYPIAKWDEIERALPRHTRSQISSYAANTLKLRRPPLNKKSASNDPLIKALKDARIAAGMSVSEYARRSGFDRSFIYRIETGSTNTSLATFRKLCAVLELELALVVVHQAVAD